MKNVKGIGLLIVLGVVGLVASQALFIVSEKEQVIITQFGEPIGEAITEPGLNIKIPFLHKANYFERRFLEWDGDPNQVPTKDKVFIFVDTYARWQITDPLRYFETLGDEQGAQARLDDILDGEARNAVAGHNLAELIRSTNREPAQDASRADIVSDSLQFISVGRDKIQEKIQQLANERAKDLGIAVLDFRFKRINYAEEVRRTVYDRMISERNRIADKFRSEGQGEASRITGEKERELLRIQSEAFQEAETIRGRADAEAAAIYNDAYNKTRQARELYAFVKSMEAYGRTIDKETSLIISTDSEFYKYLNSIDN
ncbi:MAG TPA: protease modulator HflC [Balneola sp.]|nr:HflC protein [Bacteroidota bacterium]HCI71328.1 protease modulator HflC [Balneola sp.]HCT50909.1 protease modulator HflC [Balneola sp.]|tara:strand:- start:571 stop:1518 length:948 start_codon:yes stop_codon:yes gene_type:complete